MLTFLSLLPVIWEKGFQESWIRGFEVKNYDFTFRRLDSEALRLLQHWGTV